jgi:hypothetical protein
MQIKLSDQTLEHGNWSQKWKQGLVHGILKIKTSRTEKKGGLFMKYQQF